MCQSDPVLSSFRKVCRTKEEIIDDKDSLSPQDVIFNNLTLEEYIGQISNHLKGKEQNGFD